MEGKICLVGRRPYAKPAAYRLTARALDYDEAEIKELVNAIMFRLLEEVTTQELAHEPQDGASSLVPNSAA